MQRFTDSSFKHGIAIIAAVAVALIAFNGPGELMTISSAAAAPAPPALSHQQINATLNLARSDLSKLHLHHQDNGALSADVKVAGQLQTLELWPRSVRAEDFKLMEDRGGGDLVEVDPGPERTYWGSVKNDPLTIVGATLLDDGLYASMIRDDGEVFWIEPLQPRVPGVEAGLHVAYQARDVLNCASTCGTGEQHRIAPRLVGQAPGDGGEEGTANGDGASPGLSGPTLCLTQIAFDADHEYFLDYGSVSAVSSRIASVVNAMNVQYSKEVGVVFVLTQVIVRSNIADPYSGTNASDILSEFRSHWNANHAGVTRDIAHLFTGKDIGGTIGLAYVGAICDGSFGYGIAESDFDGNFSCATDLSAHEIGHNWNADHCTCSAPAYTMNPTITCINRFHPTFDIPEIKAYRDTLGCIDCARLLSLNQEIPGQGASGKFGQSIVMVNDVNGDGQPDILVGAPENDEAGTNAGKAYMISGANGAVLWSKKGARAGDKFGFAVGATATQAIVGAPFFDTANTDAGRVYIYNATTGQLLKTKNGQGAGDRFGLAVSGGSDVNDNNAQDIFVGAPFHNTALNDVGAVYIYDGSTYGQLKKHVGENANDRFGTAVAGIGNANGGSNGDYVVGAPMNDDAGSNAGKVYVYAGETHTLLYASKTGQTAGDQFGRTVAALGTVDADANGDFAVGAPLFDKTNASNAGRAYVYSGSNGALLYHKTGEAAGDQFGSAISSAGDLDRDGRMDVAFGAPFRDANGADAGRVYVHAGVDGRLLLRITGEAAGDRLGTSLFGRNISANNRNARLAVGAALHDLPASNAGHAYLYASPSLGAGAPVPAHSSPTIADCPADVAGDDDLVDIQDIVAIFEHWSLCPSPCPPQCKADVDENCVVDVDDLLRALSAWGPCE